MEQINIILRIIADIIKVIGITIMLIGFVRILIKYATAEFQSLNNTPIYRLQHLRCEIGLYILLALDFLIASDIISTITGLEQEQLIELSVLILLRTAIGYFLNNEIRDIIPIQLPDDKKEEN